MTNILIAGSMNMDIVTQVRRHPVPGETMHGQATNFFSGGKGANQAVAAARSGATVHMAGALGDDVFGREILSGLSAEGIGVDYVLMKPVTTGVAIITIDANGENTIVLSPGANGAYTADDAAEIDFSIYDVVLLQNEIPWDTNRIILRKAKEAGARVVFNPAPALQIDSQYLSLFDLLILNEVEAAEICGLPANNPDEACRAGGMLVKMGVGEVIITLGKQGSVYVNGDGETIVTPAYRVTVVDTTAAGDTFIGAFVAQYYSGQPLSVSLRYASAAAALTVSARGAQSSIPSERKVRAFMEASSSCGPY